MHLHLIEPRADGHRLQYVRRLVEAAPEAWRLSLSTLPSSQQHPAMQALLQAAHGRLQIVPIAGEAELQQRVAGADGFRLHPVYWALFWRHWRSLSAEQKGDHVVVPFLDYCSYAIGIVGSPFGTTPFSGIVMRPDFHWADQGVVAPAPRQAALKRWTFLRLLRHRRLKNLLTIDPSLRDWVAQHRPPGHERLRYADDPSDLQGQGDRAQARRHFGIDGDGPVVLMFGSIELRKGVGSLLEMASGPAFPADGQVLVVGRQSAEVRALIAALGTGLPAGRLICVDRYVDRQDEWLAFAAADYGWVAYEGFYGPSGVVAQCRQANLPMIHRGKGLIGYQLRPASHADAPWASAHGLQVSFLASSEPRDRGIGEVIG